MFTDREGRLHPAWAFLLSALIACVAFAACGYFAAALAGDHVLRFEVIFRCCLAAALLAGFSWLLAVGNHVESHRLAAQGLPLAPGWARDFLGGCGLGAGLVALAVSAVASLGKVTFRGNLSLHSVSRCLLLLLVLLAGSLAEELMFRGYPFQRLVEAIGAGGAILVFSMLFGLVHILNPGASLWGLINTIVIGVVLSVAFLRTGALWLSWGFHFAWNATLGLLLGLPVSGIRLFNVVIHATSAGPKWLTGGDYGIEASVPGAMVVLLGLVVIWRAPLRRIVDPSLYFPVSEPSDSPPPELANPSQPPPRLGL